MVEKHRNVILFDGVCNLCNGFITFLIRRDRKALFTFASLQSDAANLLLRPFQNGLPGLDSVVYLKEDRLYYKSRAVLEILKDLGGVWRICYVGRVLPRVVCDAGYDWVARNRYGWFGKRDECMIPTPEFQSRFLD